MCISRKLFRVPNKCTFLHFYVEPDYFILKNDLVSISRLPYGGMFLPNSFFMNFSRLPHRRTNYFIIQYYLYVGFKNSGAAILIRQTYVHARNGAASFVMYYN